ncbi:hypothetical protein WJX84_002315, partial [Apatococcus fuscideae]
MQSPEDCPEAIADVIRSCLSDDPGGAAWHAGHLQRPHSSLSSPSGPRDT